MLHSFSCFRPASPNDTEGQVALTKEGRGGVFCWNLAGLRSVEYGLDYFRGARPLMSPLYLKDFLTLLNY